jgi:hypothetical protein
MTAIEARHWTHIYIDALIARIARSELATFSVSRFRYYKDVDGGYRGPKETKEDETSDIGTRTPQGTNSGNDSRGSWQPP